MGHGACGRDAVGCSGCGEGHLTYVHAQLREQDRVIAKVLGQFSAEVRLVDGSLILASLGPGIRSFKSLFAGFSPLGVPLLDRSTIYTDLLYRFNQGFQGVPR